MDKNAPKARNAKKKITTWTITEKNRQTTIMIHNNKKSYSADFSAVLPDLVNLCHSVTRHVFLVITFHQFGQNT